MTGTSLSEDTQLTLPLRNIVSLIMATGLAVWTYFGVNERLNNLETRSTILGMDVDKNSEFRIRWPRGEIGALPADAEQFLLIRNMQGQLTKVEEMISTGEAPHDQQQELVLAFYEERIVALEAAVTKLKDTQVELVHSIKGGRNNE